MWFGQDKLQILACLNMLNEASFGFHRKDLLNFPQTMKRLLSRSTKSSSGDSYPIEIQKIRTVALIGQAWSGCKARQGPQQGSILTPLQCLAINMNHLCISEDSFSLLVSHSLYSLSLFLSLFTNNYRFLITWACFIAMIILYDFPYYILFASVSTNYILDS